MYDRKRKVEWVRAGVGELIEWVEGNIGISISILSNCD